MKTEQHDEKLIPEDKKGLSSIQGRIKQKDENKRKSNRNQKIDDKDEDRINSSHSSGEIDIGEEVTIAEFSKAEVLSDDAKIHAEQKNHVDYYTKKMAYVDKPGGSFRNNSRVLFLRTFNNWIKSCLFNNYCFKVGRGASILDLGVGKGGDMFKYMKNDVKILVGADISPQLLKCAMDRLAQGHDKKKLETKIILIEDDLSDEDSLLLKKIPEHLFFDIVSCQFSLHYHFENEVRIKKFFSNVVDKLAPGGYFVGTIIDSTELLKRLNIREPKEGENFQDAAKNEPVKPTEKRPTDVKSSNLSIESENKERLTIGNDFYSIKFLNEKITNHFGIQYGFYLEDSIDTRDYEGNIAYIWEYLVIFETLVKIAKEFELELIEEQNFESFYKENVLEKDNNKSTYHNKNLYKKMVQQEKFDEACLKKQWEIISLYKYFAFMKVPKGKTQRDYRSYRPIMREIRLNMDLRPELKLKSIV